MKCRVERITPLSHLAVKIAEHELKTRAETHRMSGSKVAASVITTWTDASSDRHAPAEPAMCRSEMGQRARRDVHNSILHGIVITLLT
jgi:hypothetical protein